EQTAPSQPKPSKPKRGGKKKDSAKRVPVQFELIEGADSVLIRGPRASLDRVRRMIEEASSNKD
ncbi:MAG: hypothetical protein AAFX06_33105, partial [Planctomycetota bacterium]